MHVALASDIPEIYQGADWAGFRLRFFSDTALTVPLPVSANNVRSHLHHKRQMRRCPVTVTAGAVTHELQFSISNTLTKYIWTGWAHWGVLAEVEPGILRPLVTGEIEVLELPPVWTA